MKKFSIFVLITVMLFTGFRANAQYQDSLRRSAGFFISPALNSFFYPDGSYSDDPGFGLSAGFRYKNELRMGFFLEGGAALTTMRGSMAPVLTSYYNVYDGLWYYNREQSKLTQINITAPFLAGYRMTHGKVRFEGALGFAFNLKVLEHEKIFQSHWPNSHDFVATDFHPSFGTSFSAMARAGISIPISAKATVDLLPTLRYSCMYFTPEDFNFGSCAQTDLHKWSAGLDIGMTFKLDDPSEKTETKTVFNQSQDPAVTYNYGEEPQKDIKPVRVKAKGPKNFIYMEIGGNGMFYSINYERTVFRKDLISVQARAGYGIVPDRFSFPIAANVALGRNHKKFEMGIGTTIENITTQDIGFYEFKAHLVPSIAYRYESDKHFFLRLALMSHYFFDSGEVLPGFGVSLGGMF